MFPYCHGHEVLLKSMVVTPPLIIMAENNSDMLEWTALKAALFLQKKIIQYTHGKTRILCKHGVGMGTKGVITCPPKKETNLPTIHFPVLWCAMLVSGNVTLPETNSKKPLKINDFGNLETERTCCCFTGTPNNRICKVNLPSQQGEIPLGAWIFEIPYSLKLKGCKKWHYILDKHVQRFLAL